jgi:glycine/D-amino acid oxidase-like deaminating enzyme
MHTPIGKTTHMAAHAAPQMWNETSHSLWEATANPRPALTALENSTRADVVVVGSGYLGLSATLELASRGVDVVALDAVGPGRGASGRNGGQVIPGLKHDPDELVALLGPQQAEAAISFAGDAPDTVFELIARHGIQCSAVRHGWIQGAHTNAMLKTVERRAAQWAKRGADVQLLDADTVTSRIGCAPGLYRGGWIDRRAGLVQPLNYALGLASAAIAQGARLHHLSTVTRIRREASRWRVETSTGAHILAEQVVIATNAYSDELWPKLCNSIIPAQSYQIATDPLPAALRRAILADCPAVSDARRLLHYYRLDGEGRFVIGGRGPLSSPYSARAFAHVHRGLAQTFPQLADMPIRYRWSGRLAMTRDGMPHLHQPASGITIALGCNGRGVALTTAIGRRIARHLVEGATVPLPFPATVIREIPLHRFHKLYVSLVVQYYKIRDML